MTTSAPPEEIVRQALERAGRDPIWFFTEILGDEPWDGQAAIIESVLQHKRIAVKSCNGAGKTWLAARLALWGLVTHYEARVITTAPTDRQVAGLLWAEIHSAWRAAHERWPGLLPGRLYEIPRLQISKSWYAIGFSTNDPNAMQGIHAPFVLIILDEAGGNRGGVAAEMWEPIDGNLVGEDCHLLAIGNPTDPTSPFYLECKNPATVVHTISAFDTPNFTAFGITEDDIVAGEAVWRAKITGPLPNPELTTPQAVWDALRKYGRQSTYWQARVLGNFPEQGTDTLLWMSWIEQAKAQRDDDPGDALYTAIRMGCDIARTGDNETVLSVFGRLGETFRWRQLALHPAHQGDTTKTRDLILETAHALHIANPDAAMECRIDADGLGAPVYDMVREHVYKHEWSWLTVIGVRSGLASDDPETFANTRAQYWWAVRELFEGGRVDLLDDDLQASQLTSIKWRETPAQRTIQIETKEDAEKRGVASPDRADAAMMALAPINHAAGVYVGAAEQARSPGTSTSFAQRLKARRR